MSRITSALLVAGCLALAIAGCSPGSNASTPPSICRPSAAPSGASANGIAIRNFEFQPARDAEDSLHSVTAGTPDDRSDLFDSGEFDTGDTFDFTFRAAGTYTFFCDRLEFMRGEVVVAR